MINFNRVRSWFRLNFMGVLFSIVMFTCFALLGALACSHFENGSGNMLICWDYSQSSNDAVDKVVFPVGDRVIRFNAVAGMYVMGNNAYKIEPGEMCSIMTHK